MSRSVPNMSARMRLTPLRTRLFFGFVPLILILAVFAIFSHVLFQRFSDEVARHMEQNERVDVLADRMELELARLRSDLRQSEIQRDGRSDRAVSLDQRLAEFSRLLQQLKNRATQPEEREMVGQLANQFERFQRTINLADVADMDRLVEQIGIHSQQPLNAEGDWFQMLRGNTRIALLVGGFLALVIMAFAAWLMVKSILRPINAVTEAAEAYALGRLDHRVMEGQGGELGKLTSSLNRMAAQLDDFRRGQDEKIVRLHQFTETTLGAFPDPIFIFNNDGKIELKNPAAELWLEQIGSAGAVPDVIQKIRLRALREGENLVPQGLSEVLSWRIRGRRKVFLPRALLIRRDRSAGGVALVLHDVTRFQLMDEVKNDLIGTVSHEIKTPLTSVSMTLHLLEEESLGKLTGEQRELVVTALQDTERLLAVIHDLLDLSRLEAGRAPLEFQETHLRELVDTAAEAIVQQLAERNQSLHLAIPDDLPTCHVDVGRMTHVVRNLLENANKYAPPHSTIEVEARVASGNRLRLAVRDEGPGVPEEFRERIFDKFFRIPGNGTSGTGLGLSICREIVMAHGGRLESCHRSGNGAEFLVTLPRQSDERRERE